MVRNNDEIDTFSPYDLFENLKKNNLDPSIFDTIDEREFPKAPNFLEFAIAPQFLNTLILPKQIEIGTKLFCDYCPRCSKKGYIDTLFDQSVGNIKDNIVFLEHGICPKCKVNRFELISSKELVFRNELVGVAGQRCIPKDSLVYTNRGSIKLKDVSIGDTLTHGNVIDCFDSGLLPSLKLKTKYNYTLTGAKESHIVPVLKVRDTAKKYSNKTKWKANFYIEDTYIKDCHVGDIVLLNMADMWPLERYQLPKYTFTKTNDHCNNYNIFEFPTEVTPELARILGYLVSNGDCTRKYNVRVTLNINNTGAIEDFIQCCNSVFGRPPSIDETRETSISYSINGISVVHWLTQIVGLCAEKARNKLIPACIMQSPKEIVCEFLSSLFECDGNIYPEKNSKSIRIQYCSVSKRLTYQVRLLLLNLGIATRCDKYQTVGFRKNNIYTDNVEDGKEAYSLSTKNAEFVRRFSNLIKFVSKQKIDVLSNVVDTGRFCFYTPVGDFLYKSFNKWNPLLQDLYNKGYFPVPIESIEDGPDMEMADVSIPGTNLYTADGFVHHNSGKTKLVGLLATYINHRFLKIPSPIRTFNQTSGDMLSGTFSALSMDHSYRNLWQAFKGFMDGSPWFQNYHRFIRGEEKRLGITLLHELKASIFYGHKHLMWSATGSQDRKMRGDTRIFAAIDELGWMISDEQKTDLQNMNADAIYTALSNSLTTMRTKFNLVNGPTNFDLPPIFMTNISSPSSVKDKIMRLSKEAKRNDRILAIQCATWEMNPDYTYESLREEMSHIDELTFQRDFGSEPPLAANPFLSEARVIDKIATGKVFDNFVCQEYQEKDFLGDYFKSVKFTLTKPDKTTPRLISMDLGALKNSLSLCIFSLTPDAKPCLDFALAVKPDPVTKVRINIAQFFESFTVPLVNNFNIKYAFFDRWQSLDQVERLKSMNVHAQIYSLTYKEMDSIRGSILSQSIVIPKMKHSLDEYVREYIDDIESFDSIPLLGIQFLTVRDLGHKMSKPLLGDDDIFRAFCLGATKMSDPTIKKEFINNQNVKINTNMSVAHLGVVRSRSENGGGVGSSNIEGDGGRSIGSFRSRRK